MSAPDRSARDRTDLGVFEDRIHPPGERWVTIVMPSGSVGQVHFPDELWDDDVLPNLRKRYAARTCGSSHDDLEL